MKPDAASNPPGRSSGGGGSFAIDPSYTPLPGSGIPNEQEIAESQSTGGYTPAFNDLGDVSWATEAIFRFDR